MHGGGVAFELETGEALCGLWVSPGAEVHGCIRTEDGGVREAVAAFRPFAWTSGVPDHLGEDTVSVERLRGEGPLDHLVHFEDVEAYWGLIRDRSLALDVEYIRILENQALMDWKLRLFGDQPFQQVVRVQVDIETSCEVEGGFSDPTRAGDRVLAIGMRRGDEEVLLEIEAMTDAAERVLLKQFGEQLLVWDPDVIEGHNLFNFDLNFIYKRCRRYKVAPEWGRFGQKASTRASRIRIAERQVDFIRCDIPGRTIFDTYLMIQVFDVSTRDLPSYGLKEVARYLGVTPETGEDRTYLEGGQIQHVFDSDREVFRSYLRDDLRETKGVAEVLLPTYVAQARSFPMTLQEICLRGTANKVDMLFLDRYYHSGYSLPAMPEVRTFAGGYTKSFEVGVFTHVLHFDVASLYPSLLMLIGRNPGSDSLGVFIPMLKELREERLRYKELAKSAQTEELRQEYQARQASFKILINSFYGYLGFGGARFGDSELAGEVTQRGRDLLVSLIEGFQESGGTVLEADTDGIYVSSAKDWDHPAMLLETVNPLLPDGIDLEYDGRYNSMFCYKAKNYALYDGEKITIRGSALRNRGTEPFLKSLSDQLIRYLLGVDPENPTDLMERMEGLIQSGEMPVGQLAKSEYLSMHPEAYRKKIDSGGKPRRASLEVALKMDKPVKMGDQVSFYILPKEKGQTSDWQRANALDAFDPESAPYDPKYYIRKLKDWLKRYGEFLPQPEDDPESFRLKA